MNNNKTSNIMIFIFIGLIVIVSLFAFNIIPDPLSNSDEIVFKEKNIRLKNRSSVQIELTSSNGNVKYKSSDERIATVNEYTGYVTGINDGTATIFLYVNDEVKDECIVEVYTPVKNIAISKVSLSSAKLNLYVGNSKQLKVSISPSNATNKKIIWSTSNKNVATIDKNGNVKAIAVGTAKIKARAENGVSAICNVTVSKKSTPTTPTTPTTPSSITKNKTALFIGDSITYGKYGNYSWANYIGEKYDLKKTVNAGLSGGVFSSFRGELWLVDVAKKHKGENYDYVIMHGGINDIALVAKRGEPKGSYTANNFSGNYDTNTFIGGLETYIYTVKKQWPNAKIGYIINYRTPADKAVDPISNEYYSIIKKVCNKWGIKYIDLYSGKASNGKAYSDILKVTTNTYIQDGIHLNKNGYNVISPYIYNWMKTL